MVSHLACDHFTLCHVQSGVCLETPCVFPLYEHRLSTIARPHVILTFFAPTARVSPSVRAMNEPTLLRLKLAPLFNDIPKAARLALERAVAAGP